MLRTSALAVRCWVDNFAWIVPLPDGGALVVDPTDAAPVLAALEDAALRCRAVLCTHHHQDHVAGLLALLDAVGTVPVYGSVWDHRHQRLPVAHVPVADGGELPDLGVHTTVFEVPAHTLGAIALLVDGRSLFTGDTLFAAGCGRLFEGTAQQLDHALYTVLGALPGETQVHCGHEYTLANLRFAAAVDPQNPAVSAAITRAEARLARGEPTVPTTLADERCYNPFLRCDDFTLRGTLGFGPEHDRSTVLGALRARKDQFRTS